MAAERVIWSVEDVKTLLTIWAEDSVQRKIDGVCRNEDVMKFISSEMAKVGVFRTTRQVREKLKKLRASYKAAKIHNGRSGVAPKKFPFYDLMDSVLGHRPSQSTGRNTAELQDLLASLERVAREDRECEVMLRETEMKSEQEMREREMENTQQQAQQLGQELGLQMQLAREAWAEQMRREDSRGKEMLSLLAAMIHKK